MVREGGKNVNDGKSRGEAEDRTRQCERNFEGKKRRNGCTSNKTRLQKIDGEESRMIM